MAIKSRTKYTSKGTHSSVSSTVTRAVRSARTVVDKMANITSAWKAGKNPWVTIENPDKSATNKLFIKVPANTYFGSPFAKKE